MPARPSCSIRSARPAACAATKPASTSPDAPANAGDVAGAPAQQRHRAARVAAPGVREADRDLGEAAPQLAFRPRNGLPGRLEDLVGVERPALGEQPAAELGRLGGRDDQVVGDARHVLRGRPGKRPAKLVPRARVARPPGGVPVAVALCSHPVRSPVRLGVG